LAPDLVPDPGCPYAAPPGGPSGKFEEPLGLAIDPYGNEYVASFDSSNGGRIDIFDDEGKFITEVAVTNPKSLAIDSKGNLYVFKSSGGLFRYPPSIYDPEVGKIEYANSPITVAQSGFVGALAIDSTNDQLFQSNNDGEIIRYASAEAGNGVLESFELEGENNWTESIALDAQRRRIYVSSCLSYAPCIVKVIEADAPHSVLQEIDGSTTPAGKFTINFGRLGLAVDEETGEFFIGDFAEKKKVWRFNEDYEFLQQISSSEFGAGANPVQMAVSNGELPLGQDAFNRHYLFVPTYNKGRALAFRPLPKLPPVIEHVSVAGIGETEAELRAKIDPEGADTSYVFEYTTQAAFEEEGFASAAIAAENTISGASPSTDVAAILNGLSAGATYRFRVLAENEEGKALEVNNEATFATYADAVATGACPNQGLRVGASVALPDCRAYELVTPPETTGRSPKGVPNVSFPTLQASPGGDALSFRIEGGSLPGTTGSGSLEGDPYLATRSPSGWSSALVGPSGAEASQLGPGAISADQGYSFWEGRIEGSLVIDGFESRYLRYPDGHSELIGRGSLGSDPRAEGLLIAEGGAHVIFQTKNNGKFWDAIQLEPNAPVDGTEVIYDRTIDPVTGAEETHVVSFVGQPDTYQGASADGEGIAFKPFNTLYLRKDNSVTYEIGENVKFAGISEGGERIFYVEDGDLLAFDTSSEEVIPFSSSGDVTAVNVARDGTRAYFLTPTVLTGDPNPNGDFAQFGEPNLYLSAEGELSFVATVTDGDADGEILPGQTNPSDGLGVWVDALRSQLAKGPSRLNPDGSVLLFQSRANLTGFDPKGSPQIYRYDSLANSLQCLSCIPTGVLGGGGASLQSYILNDADLAPLSSSSFVSNLTPDGKRVLFQSKEALVSRDTNGLQDVYEWEEEGVGSCRQQGGCVYLISSGRSSEDQYLFGHSRDGRDVFFTTGDALTDLDGATPSIYDARINGGFAPQAPAGECLGEACQPVVSAPDDPSPTSASFRGQGNVKEPTKARRCPSGKRQVKRRGKVRCVKKQQHQRKRANAKSRRTSK
jgi:hypothetical protein